MDAVRNQEPGYSVKVFLDVGSHRGQTLAAVKEKDFDRIECFEPVSQHWDELHRLADKRTTVNRFGLWNRTAEIELFDPGTKGAGLWIKDNRRPDLKVTRELCQFRRASDWFEKHIDSSDQVYLKLNCEGCECDILDDLLDSGEFDKVTFAMVDFDVRKISSLKHRQSELEARLAAFPAPRVMYSRNSMMGNTHRDRIHHWLGMLPAA
jgi:FkbM family methyltransferase